MITITVVYNNLPQKDGMETAWGFAALVESPDWTLLFDTGGDGNVLLRNMEKLGKRPDSVHTVVLSHAHGDHTGGLAGFLEASGTVRLAAPDTFPDKFQESARDLGHRVTLVGDALEIMPGVLTTGRMGRSIPEQGLILETGLGPVLITGCAHPGITAMTERTVDVTGRDPWLVMGGFHLSGRSSAELGAISRTLRDLGVKKIGPSHCTGQGPIDHFRLDWGGDYLPLGLGGVVQVPMVESDAR